MTESKRTAILDAASVLFFKQSGFTMLELAVQASVSRATLFRIFSGKQDIFESMRFERHIDTPAAEAPTKERILTAARNLIGKQGILATTVEQIAALSNVSAMSIYRIFGGKGDVVRQALYSTVPHDLLAQIARSQAPLRPLLTAIATEVLRFVIQNSGLIALMMAPGRRELDAFESLRTNENRLRSSLVALFEKRASTGEISRGDSSTRMRAFFGLILAESLMLPSADEPTEDELATRAARVVSQFLDGVLLSKRKERSCRKPQDEQ